MKKMKSHSVKKWCREEKGQKLLWSFSKKVVSRREEKDESGVEKRKDKSHCDHLVKKWSVEKKKRTKAIVGCCC